MRYLYPVNLIPQAGGGYLVTFPDVPEALTEGANREEALRKARDALRAAFGGYVQAGWDIPSPSDPKPDQALVYLPLLLAAKLALYSAMRKKPNSYAALADRLGVSERAMQRLVNPDYSDRIEKVEAALDALGKQIIVTEVDITSHYVTGHHYSNWATIGLLREGRILVVKNQSEVPFDGRRDHPFVQITNPNKDKQFLPIGYGSRSSTRH